MMDINLTIENHYYLLMNIFQDLIKSGINIAPIYLLDKKLSSWYLML